MKVCVFELKKQLQDIETNANQALIQDALKTMSSNHTARLSDSARPSSSSYQSGVNRRHNPFNSDDSMDGESQYEQDRQTIVEKQARTFLQMHEELREQIKEITNDWMLANPGSKATLLTRESHA